MNNWSQYKKKHYWWTVNDSIKNWLANDSIKTLWIINNSTKNLWTIVSTKRCKMNDEQLNSTKIQWISTRRKPTDEQLCFAEMLIPWHI